MRRNRILWSSIALAATLLAGGTRLSPAQAADIIDEWVNAKAPPPPALKPVTVDPKTTALLMLDFLQANCGHRPSCLAEMPVMKKLLDAARGAGATVIYSGFGNATASDVIKDVAPPANEPLIHSNADKFLNTDLDKMLKDKGIQTVITVGTAANGAILYTAGGAALRGYKVIIPVDGLSADDLYAMQFTVWELVHATPDFVSRVTLTRSDMIKF
ncbi:MAG: isochorismatase family protein [Xanthobacteraceae bacterium]|jgi:nicotinamidase-related amidase